MTHNDQLEDSLDIQDLTRVFGDRDGVRALDSISLQVPKGHLVVLLGPSGCGKTTLLRILAGLETATEGQVSFFGRPVVDTARKVSVPARDRNIGMVFQNYALWPHMKVIDIVSYPLRNKGVNKAKARAEAMGVLKFLKCDHLADRIPAQLSGGQQQRIALGRALVGSPEVVFFDEPLSNVDAQLRREVRTEIRRLHGEIGFTAIYVTHDLSEALELADTVVVMSNGAVEQVGPPQTIFEAPESAYVAEFMGIENHMDVTVSSGEVEFPFGTYAATGVFAERGTSAVRAFIRASDITVGAPRNPDDINVGEWQVRDLMYGGDKTDAIFVRGDHRLVASGHPSQFGSLTVGGQASLSIDAGRILLFESAVAA